MVPEWEMAAQGRESKSVRDTGEIKTRDQVHLGHFMTPGHLRTLRRWAELPTVNQRRDAVEGHADRFQRRERRS
jgi:hypothetical protein